MTIICYLSSSCCGPSMYRYTCFTLLWLMEKQCCIILVFESLKRHFNQSIVSRHLIDCCGQLGVRGGCGSVSAVFNNTKRTQWGQPQEQECFYRWMPQITAPHRGYTESPPGWHISTCQSVWDRRQTGFKQSWTGRRSLSLKQHRYLLLCARSKRRSQQAIKPSVDRSFKSSNTLPFHTWMDDYFLQLRLC